MDRAAVYLSPLGPMLLTSDGTALTGLWFRGQKYAPACPEPDRRDRDLPVFAQTRRWLDLYFSSQAPGFTPPLRLEGTAFQRQVWSLLTAIPYGSTRTYGDLAGALAQARGLPRMSAQAVGGAVGRNPVAIIVPCHRVVGSSGSLTGYAGGLDKKRALLRLEGVPDRRFFVPRHSAAP